MPNRLIHHYNFEIKPFKGCSLLAFLFFIQISAAPSRADVSPTAAGLLSIVPGLGQVASGHYLEGLAWGIGTIYTYSSRSPFVAHMGYDLWMYNIYDAYRDAGAKGEANTTAAQNLLAPFNPMNGLDYVGTPMVALSAASNGRGPNGEGMPNGLLFRPIYTSFTAFGEEGLFRGFLYPEFSDLFDSKFFGAFLSSSIFGLVHTQYGAVGRIEVAVLGMLFCLQKELNNGDLRKNIFAHAWWDFFSGMRTQGNRAPHMEIIPRVGLKFEI